MWDFFVALVAVASSGGGAEGTATDRAGAAPQALVAQDQTPTGKFTTATEVKPILAATRGSWVAVREWDGQDLIYVTHLWAWRCGLVQLEVAVNGAQYEVWPLPDCHEGTAQPNGITETDGLPYRPFALQSVQSIAVRVTYDDLTADEATYARAAVLMP